MKANEAPDKIYISPNSEESTYYVSNQYNRLIEYTRTDAFIEKAGKYLNDRLLNYIEYCRRGVGVSTEEFIEEFLKTIRQ